MKSKRLAQFENDFNAIETSKQLSMTFEEEVTDKRTGEKDYIIFDVMIQGQKLMAQHVGFSAKQEKNKKIAFCSVKINTDYSVDENLQELHEECMNAIIDSEYYRLGGYEEDN